MNKINLEPGRKYRGSGWVNQYGEMFFRPEQKGGKSSFHKLSSTLKNERKKP